MDWTHLVKADQVELTGDVDPLRTDAKDAESLHAALGVHQPGSQRHRYDWGHGNKNDVQSVVDDGLNRNLRRMQKSNEQHDGDHLMDSQLRGCFHRVFKQQAPHWFRMAEK